MADHRRKWDREEYEKIGKDRIKREDEEAKCCKNKKKYKSYSDEDEEEERQSLKYRNYKIDLQSNIGKSMIINKATPHSDCGYYCETCDCYIKDSLSFLDHVNGAKHQKNLGMSMRIERSSVDCVKQRLEMFKKKKSEKKENFEYNFEERVKKLKEDEVKEKEMKKEMKKERKRKAAETEDIDPEMAAVMGFCGFGSKKNC